MPALMHCFSTLLTLVCSALVVFADLLRFSRLCFRAPTAVAAQNLFLRKQLGLYIERKAKPRRATDSLRFTLARLSRFFDWRNTLTCQTGHSHPFGIAKDTACLGGGNLGLAAGHAFRTTC